MADTTTISTNKSVIFTNTHLSNTFKWYLDILTSFLYDRAIMLDVFGSIVVHFYMAHTVTIFTLHSSLQATSKIKASYIV